MISLDDLCDWAEKEAVAVQSGMRFTPSSQGDGYWVLEDLSQTGPANARAAAALEFLRTYAGGDSEWYRLARQSFENSGQRQSFASGVHAIGDVLLQWVAALRGGITRPPDQTVETVRQVAAADIMGQVRSLLEDRSVQPAAPIVLAGAALETALRSLLEEHGLAVSGTGGISAYAGVLRTADLITKQQVKDLEQMAGLRNAAAHGHFEELSRERAGLMEQQVNLFLSQMAELVDK